VSFRHVSVLLASATGQVSLLHLASCAGKRKSDGGDCRDAESLPIISGHDDGADAFSVARLRPSGATYEQRGGLNLVIVSRPPLYRCQPEADMPQAVWQGECTSWRFDAGHLNLLIDKAPSKRQEEPARGTAALLVPPSFGPEAKPQIYDIQNAIPAPSLPEEAARPPVGGLGAGDACAAGRVRLMAKRRIAFE
jgi:hypothetical protein